MVGEANKKRRRNGYSRKHDRNKFRKITNPTLQRKDLGPGRQGILISCTPHREGQAFQEAVIMLSKYLDKYDDSSIIGPESTCGEKPKPANEELDKEHQLKAGVDEEKNTSPSPTVKSAKSNGKPEEEQQGDPAAAQAAAGKAGPKPEGDVERKPGSEDLSKALDDELKDIRDPKKKVFTRIDAGANGSLFICVNNRNIDKEKLVEDALREAKASGSPNSRHCMRIMPIHSTCYAKVEDAAKTAVDVVRAHFPSPEGREVSVTYAVSFRHRLNTGVHRDDYIPAIAKAIEEFEPRYKVDLTKPDVTLIVEVVKTTCCVGTFRYFFDLAKMNLREAACPSQPNSGKPAGTDLNGKTTPQTEKGKQEENISGERGDSDQASAEPQHEKPMAQEAGGPAAKEEKKSPALENASAAGKPPSATEKTSAAEKASATEKGSGTEKS